MILFDDMIQKKEIVSLFRHLEGILRYKDLGNKFNCNYRKESEELANDLSKQYKQHNAVFDIHIERKEADEFYIDLKYKNNNEDFDINRILFHYSQSNNKIVASSIDCMVYFKPMNLDILYTLSKEWDGENFVSISIEDTINKVHLYELFFNEGKCTNIDIHCLMPTKTYKRDSVINLDLKLKNDEMLNKIQQFARKNTNLLNEIFEKTLKGELISGEEKELILLKHDVDIQNDKMIDILAPHFDLQKSHFYKMISTIPKDNKKLIL